MINHNLSNYYGIDAKIALLPHIDSVPGTWSPFGINLPDLGLTEKIGFGGTNPLVAMNNSSGKTLGTMTSTDTFASDMKASAYQAPPGVYISPAQANKTLAAQGLNPQGQPQTPTAPKPTIRTEEDAIANGFKNFEDALKAGAADDARLIDEIYNSNSDYLNQAESNLRSDYPTILDEINAQYNNSVNTAGKNRDMSLGSVNEQQLQATQRNENVLADSRRLYDELRRGYQARFGGSSSAGQAASEISAVEQQRWAGRNQQDFGTTLRQINASRDQIEAKYTDQIGQLDLQRNSAANEAKRDFDNKINQITRARGENEAARRTAQLSALREYRDKVIQINLQNDQYKQQLQAQREANLSSLAAYNQQLEQQALAAQNAFGIYNSQPKVTSNLLASTSTGTGTTNPYLGSINKKDDLIGYVSPNRDEFQSLLV